jgi:hypothetical protein
MPKKQRERCLQIYFNRLKKSYSKQAIQEEKQKKNLCAQKPSVML